MVKWQKVTEGECEKISEIPEGAFPVEIEGLEVEGFCIVCGIPLLETDKYYTDTDGELICATCIPTLDEPSSLDDE